MMDKIVSQDDAPPSPRRSCFGILVLVLIAIACTAPVAYFIGGLQAERQLYDRQAAEEAREIQTFLSKYPDRYSKITIHSGCEGRSGVMGKVKSQTDLDMLTANMGRLFGEKAARSTKSLVVVSDDAEPKGGPKKVQD
jgi:hypothetical protein